MARDEAFAILEGGASHERLKAARSLTSSASVRDLPAIRSALRKEAVSFVKRALEQAIMRLETGDVAVAAAELETDAEPDSERRAYVRAVRWVSESLLHEIHPRVGAIRHAARKAIPDYEDSFLKRRVDALASVLSGIEELRKASSAASIHRFNLGELLSKIVTEETHSTSAEVFLQGSRDATAFGDPNLLLLAIGNALRNAVEATASVGPTARPVIVSWGETDVDFWVTILDHGPGLAGPTEAAFEIGRTTKTGHRGFGLAIARQAMQTLDGSIGLQQAAGGGARVDIRWFK